jgi:hypothetical protein
VRLRTLFLEDLAKKEMKKIIDNMNANGDIEPLIVVTPTFYGDKEDTALFHEELIKKLFLGRNYV